MRTVTITIWNNKKLELFVEKVKDGFELWTVGIVKGQRILLDHHLTHDDLETRLEYTRPEDLIWRDADLSEIPAEKHKMAIEGEESIKRNSFWDSITRNLASKHFLDRDRKAIATARKAILGRWTDGDLTFYLEPNNKMQWFCSDHEHWLNRRRNPAPDWWDLSSVWELHLMANMNTPQARGTHVSVLHVDEKELHICGGHLNRIVHVFRREAP
jgi:hypothetical protein